MYEDIFVLQAYLKYFSIFCFQAYYKNIVEFFFTSRDLSKQFWKGAIEHHSFFRCRSVNTVRKHRKAVLTRGSSFRSDINEFNAVNCNFSWIVTLVDYHFFQEQVLCSLSISIWLMSPCLDLSRFPYHMLRGIVDYCVVFHQCCVVFDMLCIFEH